MEIYSVRYIHDIGNHLKNAHVDEQLTFINYSSDLWALASTSSYER